MTDPEQPNRERGNKMTKAIKKTEALECQHESTEKESFVDEYPPYSHRSRTRITSCKDCGEETERDTEWF